MVTLSTSSGAVPELRIHTVWPALERPPSRAPKSTGLGVTSIRGRGIGLGGSTPTPTSLTWCGLPAALSNSSSSVSRTPRPRGVNSTTTSQPSPGAIHPRVQVWLLTSNSLAPAALGLRLPTTKGPEPIFLTRTARGAPDRPTSHRPKSTGSGMISTRGSAGGSLPGSTVPLSPT